ncbi:MAG: hypothetical protein ACE5JG_10805, partial [Planctomycetota bacterium]
SLSEVREDLARRTAERDEFVRSITRGALAEYERVRFRYKDALAAVDGFIDREAGRMGDDLHCSACYMAVTSNDAVTLLGGNKLLRCRSCTRILYVP